jgi:hypothetical protein
LGSSAFTTGALVISRPSELADTNRLDVPKFAEESKLGMRVWRDADRS